MKLVVSAGFALVLSAYALSGAPASALQTPAVAAISQNGIVKVHHWHGRRYWHRRCERVHYKCSRRYGWSRYRFHECVARRGCGR